MAKASRKAPASRDQTSKLRVAEVARQQWGVVGCRRLANCGVTKSTACRWRADARLLCFHTDGGPAVFTGQTHQDLPAALEELSLDGDGRALVLTGTGDTFMDQIDGPSLGEIFKPAAWEKTRVEGAKILQRLLDLPTPVVGVANGPATVHSEYLRRRITRDVPVGMALEGLTAADLPYQRDR